MTRKKIGLIFFTFIGLYLITFLAYPKMDWKYYSELSMAKILFDVISTLMLSVCIVELCFYIDRRLAKSLQWTQNAMRRLLLQTILQIIFVLLFLVLYFSFTYLLMKLMHINYESNQVHSNAIWYYLAAIVFLTLLITAINTVSYLSESWKKEIMNATEQKIKAAESKQLAAETELQALGLQLDPHFAFNNLSVLSELILKDQQLGFEYTENFAKVYRYLLLNSKKRLISLQEELKFLDAYLFLLKNRMGEGVFFEVNIASKYLSWNLPPVTLQLLIENAVKYNRTEKENPLIIKILTNEQDELVVINNLLPLIKNPHSSGLGLKNIVTRYALLSDRAPQIEQSVLSFTVKIPLLQ